MYLVTRRDLSPAQQAIQAIHAALALRNQQPDISDLPLALLVAEDELELFWLAARAHQKQITYAAFYEPDIGYELTAIAMGPGIEARHICKKYPLALQEGHSHAQHTQEDSHPGN